MASRDHREVLEMARRHHVLIKDRLHAWALEEHDGCTALVSYWYGQRKRIHAQVVFIDHNRALDMELVAAWLMAQSGSGPAILDVLKSMYGRPLESARVRDQQSPQASSQRIQ